MEVSQSRVRPTKFSLGGLSELIVGHFDRYNRRKLFYHTFALLRVHLASKATENFTYLFDILTRLDQLLNSGYWHIFQYLMDQREARIYAETNKMFIKIFHVRQRKLRVQSPERLTQKEFTC